MQVKKFTFNPFQENTFVLIAENKDCIVVDPGCYTEAEQEELLTYIQKENLNPIKLINTHCHIDHILGNALIANQFNLELEAHEIEQDVLERMPAWGMQYGIVMESSPKISKLLKAGDKISLGTEELEVLFVPGHSPGHVALVNHTSKFVVGGDVLFKGSFGRVDLTGGDIKTLVNSIMLTLFNLPNDYVVYPGHMEETTIGAEKKSNMIYQFT